MLFFFFQKMQLWGPSVRQKICASSFFRQTSQPERNMSAVFKLGKGCWLFPIAFVTFTLMKMGMKDIVEPGLIRVGTAWASIYSYIKIAPSWFASRLGENEVKKLINFSKHLCYFFSVCKNSVGRIWISRGTFILSIRLFLLPLKIHCHMSFCSQ